MAFLGVSKRYFAPLMTCCFIRIRWEQCHCLFKYAFNVIQNWEADVLQFYSMGAYFLLAVMVEEEPAKDG